MIPKALDQICAADIRGLVGTAEEGPTLEFKRDLPGDDRDARKEFVADICSLANSKGGDLIFGIEEDGDGVACSVIPQEFNSDELITKLTNVLNDGLEPKLHGIGMRAVDMDDTGRVLVIRVPRSYSGIHRSTRDYHFWVRETRSKRQLDVPGITSRFRDFLGREDRVMDFFARRYSAIGSNMYPIPLTEGPKVVVHLLPPRDFLSGEEVDLSAVNQPGTFPVIPYQNSGDAAMTQEGVLHHANVVNGQVRACTLIHRSGVVEAVAGLELRRDGLENIYLPLEMAESYFYKFLASALVKTADNLTGGWPVCARLAIVGANLAPAKSSNPDIEFYLGNRAPIRFHGPVLTLPDVLFEEMPANYLISLRPVFDRLWQAAGYAQSHSYQERAGNLHWQDRPV